MEIKKLGMGLGLITKCSKVSDCASENVQFSYTIIFSRADLRIDYYFLDFMT